MKNAALSKILLVVIVTSLNINKSISQSSGIDFHDGSWEEVLQEAEKQKKFIFVDFYADWCGPCIWMQNNVFPDAELGEYFNSNFINYQVDAEREEVVLVEAMQIEAFPSLVFFDGEGNLLLENVGALDIAGLKNAGRRVISFPELSRSYKEDPTDIKRLIEYLEIYKSINPREAADLANEALNRMEDMELESPEAWYLMVHFPGNYQSRETKYVVENADYYYNTYDDFGKYLGELYSVIIEEAVKEDNPELSRISADYEIRIREKIGILEFSPDYYYMDAYGQYYLEKGDLDDYFEYTDNLVRQYRFDDWSFLVQLSIQHAEAFYDDNLKMVIILGWSEQALRLEDNHYTNFAVSYIYNMMGRKDEALFFANKALEQCQDPEICEELKGYIGEIGDE